MMTDMARDTVGIYLHIPFCLSKCYYCDFCSVSHGASEQIEAYTKRLCCEITDFSGHLQKPMPIADTVYFGGGTPTLLSTDQFNRILQAVEDVFGIDKDAEITAECNPKTVELQKLCQLRTLGINRLSLGMQSVHDDELRALGRIHSFADFQKTFFEAREAGFDNLSADLMYGIPLQTAERFRKTMETLVALAPEHISSYCLTVEEGTNFGRRGDSLVLPDEDAVSGMYADMSAYLPAVGYGKYEISNFAKAGRESRHNLKYWKCEDYLGFGAAAYGCFKGVRYGHSRDITAYLAGKEIYEGVEHLTLKDRMNEYVMLGMRLASGASATDFRARFGCEFAAAFGRFAKYAPRFLTVDEDGCRFTDQGMFVSNYILSDVMDFDR